MKFPKNYFFSGNQYTRSTRGFTGAGIIDSGYPSDISAWKWPDGFGENGIDAALYSGTKCYFFSGDKYIRVTRGRKGSGDVDPGYPSDISAWNWPDGFGKNGIDAALYSRTKCYFFSGDKYIRVTRGDTGPGEVDPGYPKSISAWKWPDGFGENGIDAALYSGTKCYFFSGDKYIRVTRGDIGSGEVDPGYPSNISAWNWPDGFGENGIDAVLYSPLAKDLLRPKEKLMPGDRIQSRNGAHELLYQEDGNLVIKSIISGDVWSTQTKGSPKEVEMKEDGNLVVIGADGELKWSSNTGGGSPCTLVMQDDRNAVIYRRSTKDGKSTIESVFNSETWADPELFIPKVCKLSNSDHNKFMTAIGGDIVLTCKHPSTYYICIIAIITIAIALEFKSDDPFGPNNELTKIYNASSDTVKKAGKDVSREAKNLGGNVSEAFKKVFGI